MNSLDIAPLLRGHTFNGTSSSIVHQIEHLDQPDLTCTLDQLASQLTPTTRSVHIKEVGFFLIGADYDDAVKGTSHAPHASGREAIVHNRVAVVTGGAQGFGEGIVRGLCDHGALVFIADLNIEGAKTLAHELNQKAGRTTAFPIACNVTDETSVQSMVTSIVKKVGGIDLFISNAGVLKAGSVKTLTKTDFELVTDVNYLGFFLCTKYVAPIMEIMNRPSGNYATDITSITSKSALEGSNRNAAYAGSKFGSIGLVQSFAKELVEDCTKVNTVCPGNFFDGPLWSDPTTGLFVQYLESGKVPGAQTIEEVRRHYEAQIPMGRGCSSDDILKAILYLVEQQYETGQALPVTGGQVMLN